MDPLPALVAGPSTAGWCLQPHTVSISLSECWPPPPLPMQFAPTWFRGWERHLQNNSRRSFQPVRTIPGHHSCTWARGGSPGWDPSGSGRIFLIGALHMSNRQYLNFYPRFRVEKGKIGDSIKTRSHKTRPDWLSGSWLAVRCCLPWCGYWGCANADYQGRQW